MPKSRSYCYWLKGLDKPICFRLKIDSEAYVLWNYYFLEKHKRKKKRIKTTIEQIIKMARERKGSNKKYETFVLNIMRDVGDSGQKAFDKIFELAIERYHEMQEKGLLPRLLPYRVVAPRIDVSRRQPITETIEAEKKAQQRKTNLDKVKAWFPEKLQSCLTFEIEGTKVILKMSKSYLDKQTEWTPIMRIVNEHRGQWVPENRSWVIPLK